VFLLIIGLLIGDLLAGLSVYMIGDGIEFMKGKTDEYDIICVDSTDPIGPAVGLFNKDFYQNVFKALKDDGIVTAQQESYIRHPEFLEVMNNYCTSLGDCGVSANVAGDIDASRFAVTINENNLSASYVALLKNLAKPTGNEEIIYNVTDLLNELAEGEGAGLFGIDSDLAKNGWADVAFNWTTALGTGVSFWSMATGKLGIVLA
jgi:hypothetical protein